ncbi:MAG TPA: HD domain-containing phosphohydrolase [Gaiellaceae bacterium]|jgi:response regulator RpfG family c-di-GMP phosphodiesterase|nr:HD domain-containing phosphohydrolase [Gaiellaceae bacterium]
MNQLRILVVDDDIALCELVRAALELEGLEVDEAHHVVEAEKIVMDRVPDAIVLDIGLPGIDGLFYCARLRENPLTRHIPIIAISGSENVGERSIAAGANAFVHKPFDPLELLTLIERTLGVTPLERAFGPGVSHETAHANATELGRLLEVGRRRHELLDRAYRETLAAIATSLEMRGLETSAHTERVTAYAMRLTVEVAPALSDDSSLEWGFLFHDIGNIGVPDRILLKRGSLKTEDWKCLREHTTIGERLLQHVPLLAGEGLQVVRSHHERWDGSGYPDGTAGEKTSIGARIFAVADALDAMTDRRPYRRPLRWDAALGRIRKGAGSHFDPDVVDGLLACEPDLIAIRKRFSGTTTDDLREPESEHDDVAATGHTWPGSQTRSPEPTRLGLARLAAALD